MPKKSAYEKIKRPGDVFIMEADELRSDDIVIPIMGQTGAGKSTFVNNVLRKPVAPVNHEFQSCTQQLGHYIMELPEDWASRYNIEAHRRLVLVDTPGFDDTSVSDSEILRRIAVWLAASYGMDMKVAGVIYVHPIYPNRMTQNDCSNVKVFRKLCGDEGLSKVILATTRWDICPENVGLRREEELVNTFWTNLLSGQEKATMMRLLDTGDSAQAIVTTILERLEQSRIDGVILALQDQLVKRKKKLQQTDAAQELRQKLVELLRESGASSGARRERLRSLGRQIEELRIPLGARIKAMLGLG